MKNIMGALMVLSCLGFLAPDSALGLANEEKLKELCEQKNGLACLQVGEYERVMNRNKKEALAYFRKGCTANNNTACVHAGILIQEQGKQYSKQWKEAAKLYEKACDDDHDKGCFNLGILKYKEGRAKRAIKYLKKACKLDNPVACHNVKKLEH